MSRAAGALRFSASERLFRLAHRNSRLWPSTVRLPPLQWRCQLPSTGSIAITSAPRSPSIWMPSGPMRKWLKLSTRTPSRGSMVQVTLAMRGSAPFVIRAKAGIQGSRDGRRCVWPWMPAFAGMTGKSDDDELNLDPEVLGVAPLDLLGLGFDGDGVVGHQLDLA